MSSYFGIASILICFVVLQVTWYYHAEETVNGRHPLEPKGGLYLSEHGDENDVQTISHRCDVLAFAEYAKRVKQLGLSFSELENSPLGEQDDLYYFGGTYDPIAKKTRYERDNPAITGDDAPGKQGVKTEDNDEVRNEEEEEDDDEEEDEGEENDG